MSVNIKKCSSEKCKLVCAKGYTDINQSTVNCANGKWALDVSIVSCEKKNDNDGGYGG